MGGEGGRIKNQHVLKITSQTPSYKEAEKSSANNVDLRVGGLLHYGKHDYEHLNWIKRSLEIGDEILIRVVETSALTEPVCKRREDPNLVKNARREYYENLKQEYE